MPAASSTPTAAVLMPAFTDCHTHACWAGDRTDEWAARLAGASYLELLKAGGGIMSTVRAVRAASQSELTDLLLERLHTMLANGTTVVEVEVGLRPDHSRRTQDAPRHPRRQRAIPRHRHPHRLHRPRPRPRRPARHVHPHDHRRNSPAVTAEFPGIAIDAYAEPAAWHLDECLELFDKSMERGHPCRVHADQFTSFGMVEAAVDRNFLSVDHLEASSPELLKRVASSDTHAVALPCSGFHVDRRYADARTLIDSGARLCIATNLNPGSRPCPSMPMAIALACRLQRLASHHARRSHPRDNTHAVTHARLGNHGTITPGAQADAILLHHTNERELAHTFGANPVDRVWIAGVEQ